MPNVIDETGNRYGGLLVLERAGCTEAKKAKWLCQCDCGNTATVVGSGLRNGVRKSCGCLHHEDSVHLINEVGNRYGKLLVVERSENTTDGQAQWLCQCDCGNKAVVRGTCLRRHNGTETCGCFHQDRILPNGLAAQRKLLYRYRRNAKLRGYKWALADGEFYQLTRKPCHYCGTLPTQIARTQATSENYVYNGIDRLDNSQGYTADNAVSCCGTCNAMKATMTYKEFVEMIERIYRHRITYQ
jgi:hypothetical protein